LPKGKEGVCGIWLFEIKILGAGVVLSRNCFMGCPCVPQCLLALPTMARILCLDSLSSIVVGLFLYEDFGNMIFLACVET
jgi:hypothetical protein